MRRRVVRELAKQQCLAERRRKTAIEAGERDRVDGRAESRRRRDGDGRRQVLIIAFVGAEETHAIADQRTTCAQTDLIAPVAGLSGCYADAAHVDGTPLL